MAGTCTYNQGIAWARVRVYRWGYYYDGYCASAHLAGYPVPPPPYQSGLKVIAGGLNLRSGPGLGYAVRRIVPCGTILQPTGATHWSGGRRWTQAFIDGTALWAASEYLVAV